MQAQGAEVGELVIAEEVEIPTNEEKKTKDVESETQNAAPVLLELAEKAVVDQRKTLAKVVDAAVQSLTDKDTPKQRTKRPYKPRKSRKNLVTVPFLNPTLSQLLKGPPRSLETLQQEATSSTHAEPISTLYNQSRFAAAPTYLNCDCPEVKLHPAPGAITSNFYQRFLNVKYTFSLDLTNGILLCVHPTNTSRNITITLSFLDNIPRTPNVILLCMEHMIYRHKECVQEFISCGPLCVIPFWYVSGMNQWVKSCPMLQVGEQIHNQSVSCCSLLSARYPPDPKERLYRH